MSENKISIREWVKNYNAGKYKNKDFHTQIEAGWYDWFCKDAALCNKTKRLAGKLKKLIGSPKIDVDKNYVFFKNNCPMMGKLYDDFRICDMVTGDVIYTITPASGHDAEFGKSAVWGKENDFKEPLVTGSWENVEEFFKSDKMPDFFKSK